MSRPARPDDRVRSPIIEQIDDRRVELGWTQRDLADACLTSQSHMSSVLSGRSDPTLLVLERMCIAVGLRLAVIYVGETQHGVR